VNTRQSEVAADKLAVLVVIHHYLPGFRTGGPVRTTANMVEKLGDEIDFKILTADRDKGTQQSYATIVPGCWQNVGKAQVRYLCPSELTALQMSRIISKCSFDLYYLNSVFAITTIQVLLLYKLRLIPHKPIILAPRGHLDRGALSLKPSKKRFFLQIAKLIGLFRNVTWHASDRMELADIVHEFGARYQPRVQVIPNLSSPDLQYEISRTIPKRGGHLRLVYLSRISRKKNLDYLLKTLIHIQGQVLFDIYGPIDDPVYWQECQMLFDFLSPGVTVSYNGVAPFDQVHKILSKYHLFVLPTLGENFGHVVLEALCAGCLVLISDRTPWRDLAQHGIGWAIPLEQPDQFRQVVQQLIELGEDTFTELSKRAWLYGQQVGADQSTLEKTRQLLSLTAQHLNEK